MSENKLTDPNTIISNTTNIISSMKDSILNLNQNCISFTNIYDEYNRDNFYDATLLKKRMKDAVIKAVHNDQL